MSAKQIEEILKTSETVGNALLDESAFPCSNVVDNLACAAREDSRPLTRAEKAKGWAARPFAAYDPERMCNSCRAYWFASMTSNALRDVLHWQRVREAEQERKERTAK